MAAAMDEPTAPDAPLPPHDVLVVGLGNLLMADDGVGVHAVRALMDDPPDGALLLEVGTAIVSAAHILGGEPRILAVDAIRAGNPPGTVAWFPARTTDSVRPYISIHEAGILNALRVLAPDASPELRIIGIEPQVVDYRMTLSPVVEQALPQLLAGIRRMVDDWRRERPPAQ